jgi:PEP-CTERM motif-containing protein
MRMNRLLGTLMVLAAAGASPAAAATQVFVGGELAGANGVTVGGATYNVEFVEGTCAGVFGGCDNASVDFTFQNLTDATAAGDALFAQVITGTVDTDPSLTLGCSSSTLCGMLIPYALGGAPVMFSAYAANNGAVANFNGGTVGGTPASFDTTIQSAFVWARFTPVTAVPEPSSWAMILLGFGGLGLAMRRRRVAALA